MNEVKLHIELEEEMDLISLLRKDLQKFYDDPETQERIHHDIERCEYRIGLINKDLKALQL